MSIREGFSLIEILVAVTIISVLIGILLPALARVRRQAQMILCVNNQRQAVGGANFFALDNDESYPLSIARVGTDTVWSWGPTRESLSASTREHQARTGR